MINPTTSVDDELYREIILDHYRHPRHRGELADADTASHGHNPLCGDEVDVTLRVRDGSLEAVAFDGQGCSISMASASMMAEEMQGLSTGQARDLIGQFRGMLVEGRDPEELGRSGDLEALSGVRRYAARIKCAMLAWTTLEAGLDQLERSNGRS